VNQPVEKNLQILKDLGLDPNWDSHDFSDQDETGCGCGKENYKDDVVVEKSTKLYAKV
jgi:hypothetical protein